MSTATRERSICLKSWEPPAFLAGRKTQIRRPVRGLQINPTDAFIEPNRPIRLANQIVTFVDFASLKDDDTLRGEHFICPFGRPGDVLIGKEAFITGYETDEGDNLIMEDEDGNEVPEQVWYRALEGDELFWLGEDGGRIAVPWKSAACIPPSLARFRWTIKRVWVERIQTISEQDAIAEGFGNDFCGKVLHRAAGRSTWDFARWIELPDGSVLDGYWCLNCVGGEAKKQGGTVQGWNDSYENDFAPTCEKCGILLSHSLTRYGVRTELDLTDEDDIRVKYTPKTGSSALALAEMAGGMGDWNRDEDEYMGRLAQIGFATQWNRDYRKHRWESNPWVWCAELEPLS